MASTVCLCARSDLAFQAAFDLSAARVIRLSGAPARYVLDGANREIACRDIAFCFSHAKIRSKESFVFFEQDMHSSINSDFTHVTLADPTATGKVPKYPLRLYFTTRADVLELKSYYTGEIFYLKNGEVGKYAINYWKFSKRYGCDERVQYNSTL